MTKNCKPKVKKNVPKKDTPSFTQKLAKFFPISIIALAGVVAIASGQEPIEWPVVQEEVDKPTVVAEAPVETTLPPIVVEQETPSVTEPGIEWPVVSEPVPERQEAVAVTPAPASTGVDTSQEVVPEIKFDPVTNTVNVKPKLEKKDVKVKTKKKPAKKKTTKPMKMTTANEDFMANFTRGMT